jgi:hypothetical protein
MNSFDKSDQLEQRLGKDAFKGIADSRRSMWTGGIGGLLLGTAGAGVYIIYNPPIGMGATLLAKRAHARSVGAALVLLGGAAGSYLGCLFLGSPALRKATEVWRSSET